ncbi:MAG TPA: DUF4340 domain-containing protein, partial [Methylomirabilota bacterium]|nr:DUF4340 domain-containing protein [Methylomirabilota bacterium]
MNWKTLVVLLVLVAGLGGFLVYDSYWLSPSREKAESVKGRLWSLEPKDVEALTIKRKTETVQLKRAADGWQMLEPVKARGDRAAIDEIVTSFVTLRKDREIDPNPSKPADFGLDPPAVEVRLEVKGRPEPLTLLLGGKNPTGVWVYARESPKPAVFTVGEIALRDATREISDLRDRAVLAFDRKSVTQVDLEFEGDRISVAAGESGAWQIVKPRPYRADADLVVDFLDKLNSARAKEFAAEAPRSLVPWGLDRPSKVTLWIGRDKERASKTLLFGRQDAAKKGVYVMRAGEPSVMLVGGELWTAFPKTVAVLRDKTVLAFAYERASRIELESARGALTLERDGPRWKITAPEALKADPAAVNSLLWAVRDLRAAGFLGETAADIPRWLSKPDVTLRIWEEGAKEPKTVLVKSSAEARQKEPMAVAAVAGQGPVVLVRAQALKDLSKTVSDLRDKSIFPAFDLKDVKRARVSAGGKRLVVERSGESDWKLLEPSRGSAREGRVTNVLLTLKALRWKEIVSPKGDDAARYGLDQPALEVSLLKADGGELGSLLVGKEEGGVTYVRLSTTPTIYAVESKSLEDLRKAQAEIPSQS